MEKTKTIYEDTRNKQGKHINIQRYCEDNGIELVRKALDVGDYMLPGGKITVDTKRDLEEVATNLLNRADSARFWREVRRAHAQGLHLVVLCEHGGEIRSINDVPKWKSAHSSVTGRALIDEMVRCEMAYNVTWLFCDRRDTARRIVEILEGSDNNGCRTEN